jgi:shikimate 5-dehydrogenase
MRLPTARQVGAVNVIRCLDDGRWVGAIFDGVGCVRLAQLSRSRITRPIAGPLSAQTGHLTSHT